MNDPGRFNFNTKIYDVAPWSGSAGADYERVFKPDWLSLARRKTDDYGSWYEHIMGTLPGCSRPPTAAQIAANANHVNAVGTECTHIIK